MGFFDKVKKFLGVNTIEVTIEAQPTFSVTDQKVSGVITLTGISDQVIKSVVLEFYREYEIQDRDSEGNTSSHTKTSMMGKCYVEAPSTIQKDEVLKLNFDLPFFYEKTFTERMKAKDGIIGGIFKRAEDGFLSDQYIIEVVVDLAEVSLDPSAKTTVKRV